MVLWLKRLLRCVGVVPIYWGSESSKPLTPGENAVIRFDNFASMKELIGMLLSLLVMGWYWLCCLITSFPDYIQELLIDEEKYSKHLEWKQKPFRKEFLAEADHALSTFICRLSDAYILGQTFYGAKKMPKPT